MKLIISSVFLFLIAYNSLAQNNLIDGYTDKLSYRSGDVVTFYTKTNSNCSGSETYTLYGIDGTSTGITNTFYCNLQTSNDDTSSYKEGFRYAATCTTWTVPSTLKSGVYFLQDNANVNKVQIIIKGNNSTIDQGGASVVIVIPTNTEAAYNAANRGSPAFPISLYTCEYGPDLTVYPCTSPPTCAASCAWCQTYSITTSCTQVNYPRVSFNRPFDPTGQITFFDGFLKWIYSSTNYAVNIISDKDMDDYTEIENAKLLILIGHSEYWTRQARMNFDKFVDAGNDAMILSGNTMWWQAEYDGTTNPQLRCYRNYVSKNNCELTDNYEWRTPVVKYSILGSIGVDWHNGSFGYSDNPSYGGFQGHKIILPTSPLLSTLTNPTPHAGDIISFDTHEYDGTLINGTDGNGYPILDQSALGFYRAELIGYDKNNTGAYLPFMAFQKTCSSGKVINVSSTNWCSGTEWAGSHGARLQEVTQKSMDLLLAGSNIWANSTAPNSFDIKPNTTNTVMVSYQAIDNGTIHGSIDITPCGVTINTNSYSTTCGSFAINNGFKVDNYNEYPWYSTPYQPGQYGPAPFAPGQPAPATRASIVTTFSGMKSGSSTNSSSNNSQQANEPNKNLQSEITIVPNPSNGVFSIYSKNTLENIEVRDILGNVIYNKAVNNSSRSDFDISNHPPGIYFLKAKGGDKFYTEKVIVQ